MPIMEDKELNKYFFCITTNDVEGLISSADTVITPITKAWEISVEKAIENGQHNTYVFKVAIFADNTDNILSISKEFAKKFGDIRVMAEELIDGIVCPKFKKLDDVEKYSFSIFTGFTEKQLANPTTEEAKRIDKTYELKNMLGDNFENWYISLAAATTAENERTLVLVSSIYDYNKYKAIKIIDKIKKNLGFENQDIKCFSISLVACGLNME